MAVVFLSYSHNDTPDADRLETDLRTAGHEVWRDKTSLLGGTPLPLGVANGIAMCDFFVVLVSARATSSTWLAREVLMYVNYDKPWDRLIPILLDDTDPNVISQLIRAINPVRIDFSKDWRHGFGDLLRALGQPDQVAGKQKVDDLTRLRFAMDLSIRAGNVAMRYYNASISANRSLDDRKSATTLADLDAQREILSRVLNHPEYSSDGFIAEEAPYNNEDTVRSSGFTWVVDPLDGTANFENGIPLFCTAVGCLRDGEPYIGVIFDPVQNEVYYAMEGLGTEIWYISRGETAQLKADQNTHELRRGIFGIHISSREEVAERFVASGRLLALSKNARHTRALGCGQLALAYVASGRLQGFVQLRTWLWDQVAGVVLVRSAGGVAGDLATHREWSWKTKDLIATANPQLHERFLQFWAALDRA